MYEHRAFTIDCFHVLLANGLTNTICVHQRVAGDGSYHGQNLFLKDHLSICVCQDVSQQRVEGVYPFLPKPPGNVMVCHSRVSWPWSDKSVDGSHIPLVSGEETLHQSGSGSGFLLEQANGIPLPDCGPHVFFKVTFFGPVVELIKINLPTYQTLGLHQGVQVAQPQEVELDIPHIVNVFPELVGVLELRHPFPLTGGFVNNCPHGKVANEGLT